MKKDIYSFPAIVLFILGIVDIIRGFMHTFVLKFSASFFAGFDLATISQDQLFMLGVFGISNILTGIIYILIGKKAKHLSPYILIIIPIAYILGLIGLRLDGVQGASVYYGRYFMYVYFIVCISTFIQFTIKKRKLQYNKV